ncbi:MAG: ATP synthase F1 subunit delta [Oscillospiraceae bacterium]|nr:ATP synthase F1 subunit delta [Oscillospiraceae bacterium]
MASVERTYAEALFSLLESENPNQDSDKSEFDKVLELLKITNEGFAATPEIFKFMNTPTISVQEKLTLIDSAFGEKVGSYVNNFLRLLVVKKRMSHFPQIYIAFRELYNEHFDIAEITVTSAMPIDIAQKMKIVAQMAKITGKAEDRIVFNEKIDKSLIGGVIVDYGNTRLDGSVKTRLAELSKNIAGTIA